MKVAIVGASGVVGQTFLQLMQERNFPLSSLKLFASSSSRDKSLAFRGENLALEPVNKNSFKGLDLVFFSAGGMVSRQWAGVAQSAGALVIDNSSAFRMEEEVPLVVPEINISSVKQKSATIVANPNCSTIQLALTLYPLHRHFGIESVVVSSYQSISGAGKKAIEQLKADSLRILTENQENNTEDDDVEERVNGYAFNCIPQIGELEDNGFCVEENKMMNETKKILSLPDLKISATSVRVPTFNGHCEALWVDLKKPIAKKDIIQALARQKGLQVVKKQALPQTRFVDGWDDVYVGRIRSLNPIKDTGWNMWIAADNLRKGAALNAIQIAEQVLLTDSPIKGTNKR